MFSLHNTKPRIVATLGPSSEALEVLTDMVTHGMSITRFNFSHGDHEAQAKRFETLKQVTSTTGATVHTFADLSGPKVRIGQLEESSYELLEGGNFVLTTRPLMGTQTIASVQFEEFIVGMVPNMQILIDDGRIELEVIEVHETDVVTRVVRGGTLFPEKGVNIPHGLTALGSLTDKDKADMIFAIKTGYDAVALSFVRKKEDIEEARSHMVEHGGKILPIIAKLETRQAMANLESIIEAADVVMVARGDLGVEVGIAHVPMYQKEICEIAKKFNKPVIVATQMLESMVESPVPTRAEVSDVVNAVLDGASYVMLSDETTIGKHPVECVQTLASILKEYKVDPI